MERVIQTLVTSADASRFEHSVLCLRTRGPIADELEAAGHRVLVLRSGAAGNRRLAFREVARVLREHQPDVLHTHNTNAWLDATLGSLLGHRAGIVHTDHARPFPDALRYMIAEHVASWRTSAVVGVSEHSTQNLRRYLRITPRKLHTIINGIDLSPFDEPFDAARKRAALGVTRSGPLLGTAARLQPQKGLTYLIQAMPRILAVHPEATLLLAGEGMLEDALRAEVASLGISHAVQFLGLRHDICEILRTLDVFVLPSIWEGLPIVILEAMAARCPIVSTAVGGIPDALSGGTSGMLVAPQDPAALASAVLDQLGDHAGRAARVESARRRAEADFSASAMARRYEALYLAAAR